ncbi:hypothetical protein WM40_24865 [Robbsia andropogonis]|uniref:Uncharacterized protein n=1 Tax=Robbsia andropogonis TaxID=28092 RepID=A0A0F5JTJ8_9BURK|nr:hypothetical protein [Robbsia andropogonis]KKB61146.1 hypothetical protein WM40_24865 [Robbsia andropogonis]MCP1121241.1 hypothetical protein [Robbsia andropogonis]MCP1131006.1 hypothetical protein [Robbsia andropogonis]
MTGSTFDSRRLMIDTECDIAIVADVGVLRPLAPDGRCLRPHNTDRYEITIHLRKSSGKALKEVTITDWLCKSCQYTPPHWVRKIAYPI